MKYINLNNLENKTVSHNRNIQKKVIIENNVVPNLTNFSQAVFKPQQIAHIHSHSDMWEVFYVESGSGLMIVNQQEYQLTRGVCIMVEPEDTHEIINNSDVDLVLNYFGIVPS